MSAAARTLQGAVTYLNYYGLWTGDRFAAHAGGLSVTAAIYKAATGTTPEVFYTDDTQALALITADDTAMEAIVYLSLTLDTQANTDPATGTADFIEHIEGWAALPAPGQAIPLPVSTVVGRIARAADVAATLAGIPLPTPRTPAA